MTPPGSRGRLPSPSPLRTGRESYPSSGSSTGESIRSRWVSSSRSCPEVRSMEQVPSSNIATGEETAKVSRPQHQSEVGTLSGRVSPPFDGPIRPITGRPSLPPTSSTLCSVPLPYGRDTISGEHRAYPVVTREECGSVRLESVPRREFLDASHESETMRSYPLTFWSWPHQPLWPVHSHEV